MFHGHKYKVTLLLLHCFPLICILLGGGGVQVGQASSNSGRGGSSSSDHYYGGVASGRRDATQQQYRGGGAAPGSKTSVPSKETTSASEDFLRREFVKAQILQRLGLSEKPHVDMAHKISKDLVLETLRRTENLNQYHDLTSSPDTSKTSANSNDRHVPSHSYANSSAIVVDEETGVANYAKTSEIISFPDKGPVLNGHNLLTFSYAGSQAFGVGVRVKKAHLWVKLDYRSSIGRHFGHLLAPKGITLYVFQVHGNFSTHTTERQAPVHLNIKDVDLELVVKRTISLDALGWQKLDVTSVVQKWYGKQSRHRIRHANRHHSHRDKLTLLVDCSGCGYCIQPIIFSREFVTSESEQVEQQQQPDSNRLQLQGGSKNDGDPYSSPKQKGHHNNFDSETNSNDYSGQPSLSQSESMNKVENFTEMPFLVLDTESAPNFKRSRRRALECSPRVKHCCKQRFYIDFKDLDWDEWIISPSGYWANFCKGECYGPHRTPDTFLNYHTHVLEEYRRTAEGQVSGITPCCAPTKFAPMSLIYFGPDLNIIKRDLPKMIVEECGCP